MNHICSASSTVINPGMEYSPKLYMMMESESQLAGNTAIMEALHNLLQRGFVVETGIPEEIITRPERFQASHDLYVLKSNTELSLSLAAILDSQGACLLNPYSACALAQDKIVTSRLLRSAGIPVPSSWVTGNLELMGYMVERMPLVIKPYRGHRGKGVRLVNNAEELAGIPYPESPVIIQEYVSGGGYDLKVYVVGDEAFGVLKESPNLSNTPQSERPSIPGKTCEITPTMRDIALRCGQVLGLKIYGIDVLETVRGPMVVDVNAFPSFRGVPNAGAMIADYIAAYAWGIPSEGWRVQSELPSSPPAVAVRPRPRL